MPSRKTPTLKRVGQIKELQGFTGSWSSCFPFWLATDQNERAELVSGSKCSRRRLPNSSLNIRAVDEDDSIGALCRARCDTFEGARMEDGVCLLEVDALEGAPG